MADNIMSQNEIDELLSALATGGSIETPGAAQPEAQAQNQPAFGQAQQMQQQQAMPFQQAPQQTQFFGQAPVQPGFLGTTGVDEQEKAQQLAIQKAKAEKKQKKTKPYDFRRPDKFVKEQLRTINKIHENFSRTVTTSLSTMLRTIVNVQVISVDQIT
ncbi:MAG TPA: hypothetical protein PKK26_17790, partial [Candidatus Wallbacteria bacterium]|nr:hypothetical protein [Candidatus Wallbacteria bacterium]